MSNSHGPLRIGIGGPVGSGKTALMDLLCKAMRDSYDIAAITNDIYTKWDAEFLVRSGSLTADRIAGVETGGCPHTAIREDASMNLAAVADMRAKFPDLDLVLIESGGRARAPPEKTPPPRAGPPARAPICSTTKRPPSRRMAAPPWKRWRSMRAGCG